MVAECLAARSVLGFLSFVLLFPSSRSVFIRDLSLVVVIPECCSRESVFAVLVLFQNDRSPTKFLGDDDFIKKEVILNLVQDLPIVLSVVGAGP